MAMNLLLSPRKLAILALILAGLISLRLEGRPRPAANQVAPEAAPDSRSPAGRRPCQNTNHAPCR